MSKKPWRNPANPEFKNPGLDTSTIQEPANTGEPAKAREARPQHSAHGALHKDTGPGSDAWAILALRRTAEFLDEFVQQARAALKRVAPDRLDAILNQPAPEPQQADPKKRPRGTAHPVTVLHKLAVGAARLLERLLKASNPSLFTLSPDKADRLALAREGPDYIARVNHARAQQVA